VKLDDLVASLTPADQEKLLQQVQDYKDAVDRERCQKSFMAYVKKMWPGFIHGRHHAVMAKKFEEIAEGKLKRLIINLGPRHAIMTSMKIPTVAGIKTMADLKVGDYVFGPDGKPTLVLGKSEIFKDRQLYKVTTDDGFSLVVDGEHLWTVSLHRGDRKFFDYTTEQLWERQNGAMFRASRKTKVIQRQNKSCDPAKVRMPMLPSMAAVERPAADLLVDPYVLGVWLGDGSKHQAVITCSDDDARFVRPEIERRGYATTDQSTRYTFGILDLKGELRELGVLENKHIPEQYLNASIQQRRDMLKGLMDTDGCVSKAGQCFWMQSNKALIDQVRVLLASLGIKNSVSVSEAKIGDKSYGDTWRISFYAHDVCHLPRKEERARVAKGDKFGRYIKVEKLDQTGDTQCIKVDREDGLFMAGEGHIITHNTKSEFGSYLLPSWFLGKYPEKKVIQASNTADLAVNFGRKVRNLVGSEEYAKIFPDVALRQDSKSAGRWATNKNGEYFAIGVGGTMTGKGADLLIIDDPHSEQEAALAAGRPEVYDSVFEWYSSGPRQRLQPGGAIVVIMTRWSKSDLTGKILKTAGELGKEDQWEVIELPAIMPSGKPLWPEFWSYEELSALRNELPPGKWNAQYQQNPTAEEGAIVKREWWKIWEAERPPKCEFVIQSWDTAFTKGERNDYSACTTWGVFHMNEDENDVNIILLDSFQKRMEFPELKEKAHAHYMEWEPDAFIVEAKAAGAPLIFELRKMGIPVSEYTPSRGNDKFVRINSVADLFQSGKVWAPDTRWARELIENMAAFPHASHDDDVDSAVQALIRFRQGGFLRLQTDERDDERSFKRKVAFY
jgi:predicted phage terminase large subunit-like protein